MKNKPIKTMGMFFFTFTVALTGVCMADSGKEIQNATIMVQGKAEYQFPSLAKIDMAQAIQAALSKVNGGVLKVQLENENDFLVYGIEIVSGNETMDVKVDAGSGEVLLVEKDNPDKKDHREEKDDEDDHEEKDD